MGKDTLRGRSNVTPIKREESDPAPSAVLRVARRISGEVTIDRRTALERLVLELTESAMKGLRDAADARARGDEAGAVLLTNAGRRSHALAVAAFEELAR